MDNRTKLGRRIAINRALDNFFRHEIQMSKDLMRPVSLDCQIFLNGMKDLAKKYGIKKAVSMAKKHMENVAIPPGTESILNGYLSELENIERTL